MLRIAAEVGFSDTAFLIRTAENNDDMRYFSPRIKVPFCGHATIAAGVALVELGSGRPGRQAGLPDRRSDGASPHRSGRRWGDTAELTSVSTAQSEVDSADLAEILAALDWAADELDPALAPMVADAHAYDLVLATASHGRLARLDHDFDRLRVLICTGHDYRNFYEDPGADVFTRLHSEWPLT